MSTKPHPFDRYAAYTDLEALKSISTKPLRKSIRVNTLKQSVANARKQAQEDEWSLESVPWAQEGFFVDREIRDQPLGKSKSHIFGNIYMQEASSMLPVALLDPQPHEVVLDMSAAPGSKTSQIAARMQNTGVIIANDVQEKRLGTLKQTLYRMGVINTIVTKKQGQWFGDAMTECFDKVLCDAPCTAQGTSRKDKDALKYGSEANINAMRKIQISLLDSAVHACKAGGTIVYSTCTLTPEENEQVVQEILERYQDALELIDPSKLISDLYKAVQDSEKVQQEGLPMARIWPHVYDVEGFFAAVLRKKRTTHAPSKISPELFQEQPLSKGKIEEFRNKMKEQFGAEFLEEGDRLWQRDDQIVLTNREVAEFALPVKNYSMGLPIAKRLQGSEYRLSHDFVTLRGARATRNSVHLSEDECERVLKGETIPCDDALQGDVILMYKKMPIGMCLARNGKLKNNLPRSIVQLFA